MKITDLAFVDKLLARHTLPSPESRYSVAADLVHTVLVVDRSGSMWEDDFPPTRYMAAVEACGQFLSVLETHAPKSIVSAVLFCDSARIVSKGCPLELAREKIITPMKRIIAGGGTDIAQGLKKAAAALRAHPTDAQRVIVLSDGHGGRPFSYADSLKESGSMICCVGIGGSPSDVDEVGLKGIASVDPTTETPRYRFIGDGNIEELFAHFRKLATDIVRV